ncbi:MAG: glutaminyl-peptide cyclotransferase [Fibrobacteraceae bacterium]|nr:glutaminyl-peptide cyclotransferase [Fibrobacteraceae bacterium]
MPKFIFFILLTFILSCFAETPRKVPVMLDSIPHDQTHFTQGLFFDGKELVESTGGYGGSGLYRCTPEGDVLDSARLAERYFGEGSVAVGGDIFYLTWKSKKAFIYNRKPFKPKGSFSIPTEGWGLTFWNNALLMSNGSSELLQIALGGFQVVGTIVVTDEGRPLRNLNELEVVGNTLYANIWTTGLIAVISLPEGKVTQYIDMTKKASDIRSRYPNADVLNGIAFDGKFLWITGKNWPQIYKIQMP